MSRASGRGAAPTRSRDRRLQVVHRDPRVSAACPPRTGRGIAVSDPGAWVRSLLQRLRRYLASRPSVALVFQQRGRGPGPRNVLQRLHISWAPRLQSLMAARTWTAVKASGSTVPAGRGVPIQNVSRNLGPAASTTARLHGLEMILAGRIGRSASGQTAAEGLLRRLLERGVRIETGRRASARPSSAPSSALAVHATAWSDDGGRPATRIFKRPPVPAKADGGFAPSSMHGERDRSRLSSGASVCEKGMYTEVPKIDIHRLTDEVLTAIDRRVQAYRERTGRF